MRVHIQNTVRVYKNFSLLPTIIIDLDYKSIIFTWLSVAILIEKT